MTMLDTKFVYETSLFMGKETLFYIAIWLLNKIEVCIPYHPQYVTCDKLNKGENYNIPPNHPN